MPQVPAGQQAGLLPDVLPENEAYAGERVPRLHLETSPDMFGANIGRALQGLGSTMEASSQDLFNHAVAVQKLKNEAAAIQGDADYTMKVDKANIDFETNNRGANATSNIDAHLKSLDDARQAARDALPNDDAKRQFDGRSLNVMTRGMFQAGRYAATQGQQAYTNSLQSLLTAEQEAAARSVDDKDFQGHLDNIDKIERQYTAWSGRDETSADNAAFASKSAAWTNRIDYLAKSNAPAAKKMFDDNISSLTAQDRNRLEGRVNSAVLVNGTRKVVQDTREGYMNPDLAIRQRLVGGAHINNQKSGGLDLTFGQNLTDAFTTFERQMGTGQTVKFQSAGRTTEEQAEIYARHMRETGGDIGARPAAKPGTSRHEFGRAVDIGSDDFSQQFRNWLAQPDASGQQRAAKYGLEFLSGRTGRNDPNHIQLAGDAQHRQVDIRNVPRESFTNSAIAHGENLYGNSLTPQMRDRIASEARAQWDADAHDATLNEKQDYDTVLSASLDDKIHTVSDLASAGDNVMAAYNRLDTKLQDQLRRRIEKDEPSDPLEAGRMRGMAAFSPEEFTKDDTLKYIQTGPFSKRDRQALSQEWSRLRQKPEHDPKVSTAWSMIKNTLPAELANPERGNKSQVDAQHSYLGSLQGVIRDWTAANGKPPNAVETQAIAQRLLADTGQWLPKGSPEELFRGRPISSFRNIFGLARTPGGPLYLQQPSAPERDEIIKSFEKAGIPNPSEELVHQAYTTRLYIQKFGNK